MITPKSILYVHIGGAKCGSSSIQYFLESNKDTLLQQGVVVPSIHMTSAGVCNGAQLNYFQNIFINRAVNFAESKIQLKNDLVALRDKYQAVVEGRLPAIVVSAENLSCWEGYYTLFDELNDEFDVRVIIYVRRQDDYLSSYWQQWMLKVEDDFWAWVLGSLNNIGDWAKALEPWIKVLGDERIVVRRFSRNHFVDGDLIRDFASIIGVDSDGMQTKLSRNPSFNDGVMLLASSVRDVFRDTHDNDFYQMVGEWAGESTYKKLPSQLMTFEQRGALLKCYEASNAEISRRFFDGEPLFDPITDHGAKLDESASIEGQVEILTRLMYGCYKEVVKQRGLKHKLKDLMEAKGKEKSTRRDKKGSMFKVFKGENS